MLTRRATQPYTEKAQPPADREAWLFNIVKRFPEKFHDDMMQAARITLWKSEQDYDPSSNISLCTYAFRRVMGRLKQYLRDEADSIRVSRAAQEERGITSRGMCGSFGDKLEDLTNLSQRAGFVAPQSPTDTRAILSASVRSALDTLPEDARRIVLLHAVQQCTFREIATRMGKTKTGVHETYQAAASVLSEHLADFSPFDNHYPMQAAIPHTSRSLDTGVTGTGTKGSGVTGCH